MREKQDCGKLLIGVNGDFQEYKMKYLLGVLVLFVNLSCAFAEDSSLISKMDQSSELIKLEDACPAELFAITPEKVEYTDYRSQCSLLNSECLSRCLLGSANHCVALAFNLQSEEVESKYHERLYALGCKYGSVTACTNRAAGIMRFDPERKECFAKSFELTCGEQDAWGCTMYGLVLSRGIGVEKNIDKAQKALKVGCIHGIGDEACRSAKAIEKDIIETRHGE